MGVIAKGTRVRLRTTNGGDCVVVLAETYRPTFACTFLAPEGHWFVVLADRIRSVEVVAS